MPCRGFVDCVLLLPDGSLVIVDHKTSGSGTRRQRMESGFDLQVEIYRSLANQASSASSQTGLEVKALAQGGAMAVAYHTTRDGILLLNGLAMAAPPGGVEVIDTDIASAATVRITQEIARLRAGTLRLPGEEERTMLEKAGVGLYALEMSPLVGVFTPAAPAQEGDDA